MPFDLKQAVRSILRVREERKAGPVITRTSRRFCVRCNLEISVVDGCSYGCPLDFMDPRPPGSVIVKQYRVTEELIEERIV